MNKFKACTYTCFYKVILFYLSHSFVLFFLKQDIIQYLSFQDGKRQNPRLKWQRRSFFHKVSWRNFFEEGQGKQWKKSTNFAV